ncbi:MAG: PAS domain S-box protein [Ignavibacteria bacterium]|nr:PAS domain S-box protein [Ignavibacteria bacterium]
MKTKIRNSFSSGYLNLEKKLPLEKFIPAAFVVFLLCIFILSIITYKNIERYRKDIEWISRTNEVIKKLDDVYINSILFPLINRGYAITGDKLFLLRYDSLKNTTKKEIDKLSILTQDNPDYKEKLRSLDSLAAENIKVNEIKDLSSTQEQIDITNKGRVIIREINNIITEIKLRETDLLNERKNSAERVNNSILMFIIITSLFSFMVIGMSLFISQRLIRNKSNAEGLLLKSYEELEERVEERTFELKDSNEKLTEEIKVRKKTEETLRESEQRFRMMADSAPVLIWISGKDKLCNYFNKVWLEFTGRKLEQELGIGWAEGVHKEDLQKCLDTYTTSFDSRITFEMEYRLRNAQGELRWVLDKGIPRFEGNEFVGYIGSCIDINERKKSERFLKLQYEVSKTLAESKTIKEASQNLLKNICMGIDWNFGILWLADDKNEYIKADSYWSENEIDIEEYSGFYDVNKEFTRGMGFPGLIFKEGKSRWTTDIIGDKDYIRKETAFEMGWNSGLGIPITNGKDVIAVIECFNKKSIEEKQDLIDVLESAARQIGNFIERKKAEENLRISNLELEDKVKKRTSELAAALSKLINESEEKEQIQSKIKLFAHAIRSIKDCVYITDLDNHTLFINQAFENTYGYKEKEIIGKEIPIMSNDQISATLKAISKNKTLRDGWRGELITERKKRNWLPYLPFNIINQK